MCLQNVNKNLQQTNEKQNLLDANLESFNYHFDLSRVDVLIMIQPIRWWTRDHSNGYYKDLHCMVYSCCMSLVLQYYFITHTNLVFMFS